MRAPLRSAGFWNLEPFLENHVNSETVCTFSAMILRSRPCCTAPIAAAGLISAYGALAAIMLRNVVPPPAEVMMSVTVMPSASNSFFSLAMAKGMPFAETP